MVKHLQKHEVFWQRIPSQIRDLLLQKQLAVTSPDYFSQLWVRTQAPAGSTDEFPLPTIDEDDLPSSMPSSEEEEVLSAVEEEDSVDEHVVQSPQPRHLPPRHAKHKRPHPPTPPMQPCHLSGSTRSSSSPPESDSHASDVDFTPHFLQRQQTRLHTVSTVFPRLVLSSGDESHLPSKHLKSGTTPSSHDEEGYESGVESGYY